MSELLRLRVGRPANGGRCVARVDDGGVVVFVSGAAPGELVEVEVTERRSRLWWARVVNVLEPSEDRVDHVWPAAVGAVGGLSRPAALEGHDASTADTHDGQGAGGVGGVGG
ncbi:MAG: TRAM domain-containing protein, partial [Micrococcales bacterium]|nr:TRAM domain-containing protein [Micrococcales bacterium]